MHRRLRGASNGSREEGRAGLRILLHFGPLSLSLSRRFEDLMMHFYDPGVQVRRRRRHFRSRQQIPRKRAVCKLRRAFLLSHSSCVHGVTMQSAPGPRRHFSCSVPSPSSPLPLPPQMTRNIIKGRHNFFQVSNYSLLPSFLSPPSASPFISAEGAATTTTPSSLQSKTQPRRAGWLSPCSPSFAGPSPHRTNGLWMVCSL